MSSKATSTQAYKRPVRSALVVISTIVVAGVLIGGALGDCGDRGGPGYRDQTGKCVGWAELARKCGCPPSLRCTAEHAQPETFDASKHGCAIEKFKGDAHERANRN